MDAPNVGEVPVKYSSKLRNMPEIARSNQCACRCDRRARGQWKRTSLHVPNGVISSELFESPVARLMPFRSIYLQLTDRVGAKVKRSCRWR